MIVAFLGGWILKSVKDKQDQHDQEIKQLARGKVEKEDFRLLDERIFTSLTRIEDKLDKKADKAH